MASGESIYEWIRPPPVAPEKEPLYHAKASPHAPLAGSTIKPRTHAKGWGDMGAELKGTIKPENFLKSRERTGLLESGKLPRPYVRGAAGGGGEEPAAESVGAAARSTSKSRVPLRTERPASYVEPGARPKKDFIAENAVAAILTEPKRAPKSELDWTKRPGFGAAPAYLARVKAELAAEKEYVLQLLDTAQAREAEAGGAAGMRELTSGEREELIAALKAKWDETNAKYLIIAHRKISTSSSTIGEIRYKETAEATMKQIEADINRLTKPGPIYVTD